jgi:LemA protein
MFSVWVLAGLLGVSFVLAVLIYREILRLRHQTHKAWAHIDVQLKRRYELIPHLIETAREHIHHEHEALNRVLEAHSGALAANTVRERADAESAVKPALTHVLGLAEEHPILSCHEVMEALKLELHRTEEKIHFACEYYNEIASTYNRKLRSFPNNILVGLGALRPQELFEPA